MLYRITYDLVAIPLTDYLIPNRRESRFIHALAYKFTPLPITTNVDSSRGKNSSILERYTYQHYHAPPLWHSSDMLSARWCMWLPNHQILSLLLKDISFIFFIFKLIHFFHCTNSLHPLYFSFISANPL